MRCSTLPWALCAAIFTLSARPAAADIYEEFAGARSMSMGGAHRGLGTSNDTLILNPAGMAVSKRYSVDGAYSYGAQDHINRLHVSAVDSKSAAFAAGVGYTREWGNPSGAKAGINRFYFGSAYAISPFLSVGLGARNYSGHLTESFKREKINLYNGIAGVSLNLGQLAGVGVAFENFIRTSHPELMPMRLGLGGSVHTGFLTFVGDVRWDLKTPEKHPVNFGVGGEIFLRQAFAVRGGYRIGSAEPTFQGKPLISFITAGAALMTLHGGLQGAFEYGLKENIWKFIVAGQFSM